MSYLTPNPSNLLGDESPEWMAKAFNVGTLRLTGLSTGITSAFLVTRVRSLKGMVHFSFRSNKTFGPSESLTLTLSFLAEDGSTVSMSPVVVDISNSPTGGGNFHIERTVADIPPGTAVSLSRSYSAGGGATNPALSIVVQMY